MPKRLQTLHLKTNHTATTVDGWNLHLVRTQNKNRATHTFPVILLPGLGSSGAYTFDLSPDISLADYLAELGWDVWTIELRGNGLSDKPSLFSKRGRYWTIDTMVEKDVPACMDHICMHTGNSMVHILGHSMGGMILTALLAQGGPTAARVRSAIIVGSSCFLEGSWWSPALPIMPATRFLYSVPAGLALRLYSNLAFSKFAIRLIDVLYFWPSNVEVRLAKAVLSRNFSSISPGVITQFTSAFGKQGLCSGTAPYAPFCDPEKMRRIETPVFMLCGDRDKMCPPQGVEKQFSMMGKSNKKLVILGPPATPTHYGHFCILMGRRAATEVFPLLHEWLSSYDDLDGPPEPGPPGQGSMASTPADELLGSGGATLGQLPRSRHSQSLYSQPVASPILVHSRL
ncbi:Alpha/Beta hydrolase protein [Dunaliella salina]|uniref:Alpha/Beta hydrolase protein n=1 Tax=Dunaliella salina TaxID=3046 RepID=A0ABQ7GNQ2_DUNSA|nr:Alpha/Beta hydrolase protein [Dunaliella salina]|eukprot:KAF5836247.1 Alpha/Beta hydrolase protein [Dunaliella salina]